MIIKHSYALSSLMKKRAEARRKIALERANSCLSLMNSKGIKAKLFGSILTDQFKLHSDVDFLVVECPFEWKYTIESYMMDIMLDIPFDVAYLDELSSDFKERNKEIIYD